MKKIDSDTVYRLGSLTKIFTVYTWLAQDGDVKWNEPITKYVPELAQAADKAKDDPVGNVAWDEVTVGSLAGQLSGAGRDCKCSHGILYEMERCLKSLRRKKTDIGDGTQKQKMALWEN